jgi:TolB-like protein/Flp pilus assembly protein TadD
MADFFAELKRRQIYRVGAAYVVAAWVLTQVIEILAQVFTLPLWIAQTAIVLLAIGFPVALLAAWTIESKPHQAVASAVRAKPTMLDGALFGALIIVGLLIGYQQIAPRQTGVDAAREASLDPRVGISLAVLPFANLSDDPSQEFFSDGIAQEIVTALARIPDLRVVARGSASQFKGERRDLRAVGQALGATHLIEGSVRKAGTRVRITAQLVKADDGLNAWVNSFDRELNDVFAIQEEIATAVAGALRMPLGLSAGERLVNNRNIDPESYQQFLRARAVLLRGNQSGLPAAEILEPIVARNPDFGPAWMRLSEAYYRAIVARNNAPAEERRAARETYLPKAEAAAEKAIRLDPNSIETNVLLGVIQTGPRRWAIGEDFFKKALAIDPTHPDVLNFYSGMLARVGRIKEAVVMRRRLQDLEPFIPAYSGNLAETLWLDGQVEAAIALFRENLGRPGAGAGIGLARIYSSLGRYSEAADIATQFPSAASSRELQAEAIRLLRTAPEKSNSPEALPRLADLGFIYLHVGAPERALDFYEEQAEDGTASVSLAVLWHSSYAPVRRTERFKKLVRDLGLVDYWRERGWPEFCRPVGADDFECS